MNWRMTESAVILGYIEELSAENGRSISETKLKGFMKHLGLDKGLIDFELLSLMERGLVKQIKLNGRNHYKITKKGNKYSKKVVFLN
ncbi:hypothetical protein KAU33_13935 [Candidatus Dependentiae bacterium]|nr:hypothetical protein [Candidatus Dependentiae bacterium]